MILLKRFVIATVLAATLVGASTPAYAEETCVGDLVTLPVDVCVNVPGVPPVREIVDPLIPPVLEPVLPQPVPAAPPLPPPLPLEPAPESPAEPVTQPATPAPAVTPPAVDRDPRPIPDSNPIPATDRDPRPNFVEKIFEKKLTFPFLIFVVLVAILFGGSQAYKFFLDMRAKGLDKKKKSV